MGFLPQEPKLDETKNVGENLFEAVREKLALLDEFNKALAPNLTLNRLSISDTKPHV